MSRLRCSELRKLPRSTKITAIQWRDQTPGNLEPLFTWGIYDAPKLVDPQHPGANLSKTKFPMTTRDDVGIRMLPLGLLLREDRPFPAIPILNWKERVQKAKEAGITGRRNSNIPDIQNSKFRPGEQLYPERDYNNEVTRSRNHTPSPPFLELKLKKTLSRVPMSFHVATSKVRMGHFRYQRKRVETRLRTALSLIVTKGAFHDREAGKIGINMDDSGRKWIMQGWAYMFFPSSKINQMPLAELIDLLRRLLTNMNKKAIQMENEWLNKSLLAKGLNEPTMVGSSKKIHPPKPRTSGPPTQIEEQPKNNTRSINPMVDERYDGLHPERRVKTQHKPVNSKNLPMQSLAGKAPAVWKKELVSGLESLLQLGSRSPDPKKQSSKNVR